MKIIIKLILLINVLILVGAIVYLLFPSLTKVIVLPLIATFIYGLIVIKN